LLALVVAAVVVLSLAALPTISSLVWSPLDHYECGPGATVATRDLWTPEILVNAPYGGFGNGTRTYSIPFGSSSSMVILANGSAGGLFALEEWSIAPAVRILVAGPGANAVCTGFLAMGRLLNVATGTAYLQPKNLSSNIGENTSFSYADPYGNDYDSVLFHNGYSEMDFSVSSCSGGPVVMAARASRIAVEVPFSLDGSSYTASGTIDGAFNWTYSFPGHFGTWSIDDLNAGTNARGGGLAFSFAPCP
jgi:hypothetical protein